MTSFNRGALARAGLRHDRRRHLGLALGALLTTAVLVGALAVGDSVNESLRRRAMERIGQVDAVLDAGDRMFTRELADRLSTDGHRVASLLEVTGVAVTPDRAYRANGVRVLGVDDAFFALSLDGTSPGELSPGRTFLNARLARQLGVTVGDSIVLRVEKPTALPRETPLGDGEDLVTALRVEVAGLVSPGSGGRFAREAHQIPPFNAFVDRDWIADQLEVPGRANRLIATGGAEELQAALRRRWSLADLELGFSQRDELSVLESRRILIDDATARALKDTDVDALAGSTSFVLALGSDARSLPYSSITALEVWGRAPNAAAATAALVPDDLDVDEIVLHDLAAERLELDVGARLGVEAFVFGDDLELTTKRTDGLRVRSIVPLEGAASDPGWMPPIPGLAESESCGDWDPSIPIDHGRLSKWDERYWDGHRGTPKAYVSMAAAHELWGTRYGTLTQVRVAPEDRDRLAETLLAKLDPVAVNLRFTDARAVALAASHTATDFGGLFFGLSLFLVISAVLLTAMIFVFGVEQRSREIGLLRAVGFTPASLRRHLLREAAIVGIVGAIPGVLLGVAYTRAVLAGLQTLWSEAVASASLVFHAGPVSLVGGPVIALLIAFGSLAWAVRRHVSASPTALLAGRGTVPNVARTVGIGARVLVGVAGLAAVGLGVLGAQREGPAAAGLAFGAGAMLLVSMLVLCRLLLRRPADGFGAPDGTSVLTFGRVARRGIRRRADRSLAVVTLLACGVFLVVSVGVHRLTTGEAGSDPGTGGFDLFAQSSVPIRHDLATTDARETFGFGPVLGLESVPLRMREGDEASCLNLSTAQNPLLVGVHPARLTGSTFRFAAVEGDAEDPWSLLHAPAGAAVPAIGDAASVTWALHRSLGDTIEFIDEAGRPFDVRIVATVSGSILQGMLIVDEARLRERFPAVSGFRRFLIRADDPGAASKELTRAMQDVGLEVTSTNDRLATFNAVQNTYLAIFQTLGALGVLLGTFGLALVVLRNLFERRAELAALRAIGFSRGRLARLLLIEHGALLALGAAVGATAALAAVLPLGRAATSAAPWITVVGVFIVGIASVWAAAAAATRGDLLDALQAE